MKTAKILIAVFVTGLLATASVLAQGRINFANTSTAPLRIHGPTGWVILGTASTAQFGIGPASVEIRLFAGLTSSSLSPVLIGTAADQPFVLNYGGFIAAAQGTFPGGSGLVLPGFAGGVPAFLQFTVMSINGFYYGSSSIIQVIPSIFPAPATSVFGLPFTPNAWDASDPWNGSDIAIEIGIPEPSALALLGMSLPLIFSARRRR